MTKLDKASNAISIYTQLKDEILSLGISPGDMIDELSIAKHFGVSRSPVREAFIRLAADGLIKTLPNKSSQVTPLDIEDIPVFIDALDLIQRTVVRLAAMNRSEDDLHYIKQTNEQYLAAVKERRVENMINLNYQFHMAIGRACKNKYFEHIYGRLLNEGRRTLQIFYRAFNNSPPSKGVNGHNKIITAIETQNADLAEELAHQHTQHLSDGIMQFLNQRKTNKIALEYVNHTQQP